MWRLLLFFLVTFAIFACVVGGLLYTADQWIPTVTARLGKAEEANKLLIVLPAAIATLLAALTSGVSALIQTGAQRAMNRELANQKAAEALSIGLSEFFTLKNVSAQALLSESFRNAFAVSVYLAAATLYGGEPRFVVLDDVTSSFDAGHQFHLTELIRNQFARPMQADGPQVILLSHDTLLEKLFNRNRVPSGIWLEFAEARLRVA